MAIPAAFTESRDKLQRTRQHGNCATQGVQRKRYAPLGEVIDFRRRGHMRQQITESTQRVHKSEEREHQPEKFRKGSHFWIILSRFLALRSTEWIERWPPAASSLCVNVNDFRPDLPNRHAIHVLSRLPRCFASHNNILCTDTSITWFCPSHHRFFRCNTPKECR